MTQNRLNLDYPEIVSLEARLAKVARQGNFGAKAEILRKLRSARTRLLAAELGKKKRRRVRGRTA